MIHTKIYIGSNNTTKVLEVAKVLDIINKLGNCDYTIIQAQGFYDSTSENTLIVEILGDYNTGIIPELKKQLQQKSILVITSIVNAQFYE